MGRKKEEIDEKTKNLTYPKTRKPKKKRETYQKYSEIRPHI